MKKFKYLFLALMSVVFVACGDDDNEPQKELTPQKAIVGEWHCSHNAYGVPFDDPAVMVFDAKGYGYEVMDGIRFSFGYTITDTKLFLRENYEDEYYESELEYQLLDGGKTLMLYGMDDNDLSVLRYTKVK